MGSVAGEIGHLANLGAFGVQSLRSGFAHPLLVGRESALVAWLDVNGHQMWLRLAG